jgi:hypothetical protein
MSLIRGLSSMDNRMSKIERAFESDGGVLQMKKPEEKETMILTRAERKRITGNAPPMESQPHQPSSVIASHQDSTSHKRASLTFAFPCTPNSNTSVQNIFSSTLIRQ